MGVSTSGRSECHFRIVANRCVKYITIKAGALNAESLGDMPLDFQTIMPPLPYQEDTWNSAVITLSSADLPRVETIRHTRMIDHLDIERTEYRALLTQECKWKGGSGPERMIAKMA